MNSSLESIAKKLNPIQILSEIFPENQHLIAMGEKLIDISNPESNAQTIEIGLKAYEDKDYNSAHSHLTNSDLIDDKLFADLGDKLRDNPITSESNFMQASATILSIAHAGDTYRKIQDPELLRKKMEDLAEYTKRLGSETEFQTTAASIFHFNNNNKEAANCILELLEDKKQHTTPASFNIGTILYSLQKYTSKDQFTKTVEQTAHYILDQDEIWFNKLSELLKETYNGESITFNPFLKKKIELKIKKHLPINFSEIQDLLNFQFDNKYLIQTANKLLTRISSKPILYRQDQFLAKHIMTLYQKAEKEINTEKWQNIAESANQIADISVDSEATDEFLNMAFDIYKKIDDRNGMDKIVNKYFLSDNVDFTTISYMLAKKNYHTEEEYRTFRSEKNLGFQKELFKFVNKFRSPGNSYTVQSTPEVINEILIEDYTQLLKTEPSKSNISDLYNIAKKIEENLTQEKIKKLANRFQDYDEIAYANQLFELAEWVGNIDDSWKIFEESEMQQLFWQVKDSLYSFKRANEGISYQKKKMEEIQKQLCKTTDIKNPEKLDEIFTTFSLYEDSTYIREVGIKAIKSGYLDIAINAFKTINDHETLSQLGQYYIQQEKFAEASQVLKSISSEVANTEISRALQNKITEKIKSNPKSGLEFMINIANSELKDSFKMKFKQTEHTDGCIADQVMGVFFSSDLYNLDIAIKIQKEDPKYITQLGEIEFEILKSISTDKCKTPKPIKYDVINGYSVAIIEYMKFVPLAEILQKNEIIFNGTTYNINSEKIAKMLFESSSEIYEQLEIILNEISIECTSGNKITGKDFFLSNHYMKLEEKTETNADSNLVWCKDIKPGNWGYNPENETLIAFDFNYIYLDIPASDAARFIESEHVDYDSREKIIALFLKENPHITKEDYMGCAKDQLIQSHKFHLDSGNKNTAEQRLERYNHIVSLE